MVQLHDKLRYKSGFCSTRNRLKIRKYFIVKRIFVEIGGDSMIDKQKTIRYSKKKKTGSMTADRSNRNANSYCERSTVLQYASERICALI